MFVLATGAAACPDVRLVLCTWDGHLARMSPDMIGTRTLFSLVDHWSALTCALRALPASASTAGERLEPPDASSAAALLDGLLGRLTGALAPHAAPRLDLVEVTGRSGGSWTVSGG